MSVLHEKILADLTAALKSQDELRLSVLRMLKAALQTFGIAKMGELTEEDVLKVVRQELKKRFDSVASFKAGQRMDLADKEEKEAAILQDYLPAQMNDADLEAMIEKIISVNSFTAKDFGIAMKAVMAEVGVLADGGRVAALLKQKLAG